VSKVFIADDSVPTMAGQSYIRTTATLNRMINRKLAASSWRDTGSETYIKYLISDIDSYFDVPFLAERTDNPGKDYMQP